LWKMRWAGYVAYMGEMNNAYNIRTDLREIGWEGVDWIHLA